MTASSAESLLEESSTGGAGNLIRRKIGGVVATELLLCRRAWKGRERHAGARSRAEALDLRKNRLKLAARLVGHLLMQRPAVRVHRHHGGEVLHLHLPHRLRAAELLQVNGR